MKGRLFTEMDKIQNGGRFLILFLLCLSTSYSTVTNVNDYLVLGKWYGFYTCVVIYAIFALVLSILKNDIARNADYYALCVFAVSLIIDIHCIGQIIGVFPKHAVFPYVADFDNPAGMAVSIVAAFPSVVYFKNVTKWKVVLGCYFLLDAVVLCASGTRTGLFALSVCMMLICIREDITHRSPLILVIASCLLFVLLFLVKSASSMGRLLIIRSSLQMLKKSYLFGLGKHGFAQYYMLNQASFLKQYDSDAFNMLADNISHPLNEYLMVLTNFGVVGLLIVLLIITFMIRCLYKNINSNDVYTALLTLIGLLTVSLFTYSLRYPFTILSLMWVICCCCKCCLPVFRQRCLFIIICVVSIASTPFVASSYRNHTVWNRISIVEKDETELQHLQPLYEKLQTKMHKNASFLYEYAMLLYEMSEYEEAYIVAGKSMAHKSDYNTVLLLGKICEKRKDINKAVMYLDLASDMCPSKFLPLYAKFELYENVNDIENLKKVGSEILEKRVKVNTPEIQNIRLSVRKTLFLLD